MVGTIRGIGHHGTRESQALITMDQLHAEIELKKIQSEINKHSGKKRIEMECSYLQKVNEFLKMSDQERPTYDGASFKVKKKQCESMCTEGNKLAKFVTIRHSKPLRISKPQPSETKKGGSVQQDLTEAEAETTNCSNCGSLRSTFDHKQCLEVCVDCGNCEFRTHGNNTRAEALDLIFRGQNVFKTKGHYSYKRSNHFSSWLARVQGKENVTIPTEVLDCIKNTLTKRRLDYKNKDHLTTERIRDILKEHSFPKYYANVHRIRYLLTDFRPPQLTEEQEEDLITMFHDITSLYEELQKSGKTRRSNMLSYAFILHKSTELLGFEISHLRLLKHDERMRAQEAIWKQICELSHEKGLNLPFIAGTTASMHSQFDSTSC